MTGYQRCSYRYPALLITVKHETDERSVSEKYSNSRFNRSKINTRSTYFQPTTVFYNSNHRHHQRKQPFTRPQPPPPSVPSRCETYDQRHYQTPIRPLMEREGHQFLCHYDDEDKEMLYHTSQERQPKQRGQYRNRKAELDWDHAFDLDQIDLYTTLTDIDNQSLTSLNSSSDNSFSSD